MIFLKSLTWRAIMIILSFIIPKLFGMKTKKVIGYVIVWNVVTTVIYILHEFVYEILETNNFI
jgi:hypothetical protein